MPGRESEQERSNVERRRFLKGTGAGALAVGLAGCAGDGEGTPTGTETETPTETPTQTPEQVTSPPDGVPEGGVFTIGLPSPVKTVNHLNTSSAYDTAITEHLYRGGTWVDIVNFEVHGGVFEDWTVENVDSGKPDVYIKVREFDDLTWNDGEEFTKSDVKFTYDYMDEQQPGKYLSIIQKIDVFEESERDGWDFHMKMTEVNGLYEVDQLALPILPEHIWSEVDNFAQYTPGSMDGRPVGLGWASVTTYEPDTAIELEFRDSPFTDLQWVKDHETYLSGGPWLDKLRFKMYTSNSKMEQALLNEKLDALYSSISSQNLSNAQEKDWLDIQQGRDSGFGYVGFNLRRTPFDDATFRQVIGMLWDDVYWVRRLNKNQVIEGDFVITPGYPAVRPETADDEVEMLTDPATQAFHFRQSSAGVPDVAGIRQFMEQGKVIDGSGGTYVGQDYPGSITGVTGHQSSAKHSYSFGEVQSQVLKEANVSKELYVNGKTITEIRGGPIQYLVYPPNLLPSLTKMDENLVSNMQALGIPVQRQVQTFNSLLSRIYAKEEFDMYHMGWSTGAFGAGTLYGIFHGDSADDHTVVEEGTDQENAQIQFFNAYGYGLPGKAGANDLITEALQTMDSAERNAITRKAVEKIYLDQPVNVFQYSKMLWPVNNKFNGMIEGIVDPGGFYLHDQFFNIHLAEE